MFLIAISKGSGTQRKFMRTTNPIGVPLLIAISKGRAAQRKFMRMTNPIGVPLLIAQGWRA